MHGRFNDISRKVSRYLKDLAGRAVPQPGQFGISAAEDSLSRIETLKDAHWTFTEREAQFRQLLDSQDHLIVRRDRTGHILFANAAFCRTFNLKTDEIIGAAFEPRVLASELEHTTTGPLGKPFRTTVQLVATFQGPKWILWERQTVTGANRSLESLSIGRDVSKERAHEDALRQARDEAEAASRAKSRFLASMSHEIRTPMNGILGMAGLLRETQQNGEQASYTAAITSSARALLAVIDEILDFSRIEAGKLRLAEQSFSLRGCIGDAVALLQPRALAKGLPVDCQIALECPDRVVGDAVRLRQILLNLISNAIKYTDKGEIAVRATAPGHEPKGRVADIVIEVQDTGIGFSASDAEQLFNEFEQTEAAIGRAEGGTGLGLAISRRLARAMGGDITAHAMPGAGATFTLTVRLIRAQEVSVDAPVASQRAPVAKAAEIEAVVLPLLRARPVGENDPPRVLIAEDNEINALLARRMVEKSGCEVTAVATGRAAVAAVAQSLAKQGPAFDLVLMDLFMPELDGISATRTILGFETTLGVASHELPPIVALTANAFAEDRLRCLGAGMVDYLAKPFDAGQLAELLDRWVYARRRTAGSEISAPAVLHH